MVIWDVPFKIESKKKFPQELVLRIPRDDLNVVVDSKILWDKAFT